MQIDIKGALGIVVVLACFGLLGVYVIRGQTPDATAVAIITAPLGLVLGFYFGHMNGSQTALLNATTQLANRSGQPAVPPVAATAKQADPGPPPG